MRPCALVIALLVVAACAAPREDVGTALSAASPSPVPCPAAHTSPLMPTALPSASVGSDLRRITSAAGGWSLEIPDAWLANAAIGNARALRGADIYSYDPTGLPFSGNVPPPGGIRMSVGLQPNLHGRDPVEYAAKEPSSSAGATVLERRSVTLAGVPAMLIVGRSYSPAPFDLIHAWWFVRPPHAPDRMLVIDAWPIDTTTRVQVERIASTLQLFGLPPVSTVPAITREQAERCYLTPQIRRADRIEAKLMLWRDYELVLERVRPDGPRPWGGEPDRLLWAVLIVGDIAPSLKGPPPPPSGAPRPAVAPRFVVLFVDAMTGATTAQDGGLSEQPEWWEVLADRAR